MPLDKLTAFLIDAHTQEAARVFEKFSIQEQTEFLQEATLEQSVSLMNTLPLALTVRLISELPCTDGSLILSSLKTGVTANILRGLPSELASERLNALSKSALKAVKSRLGYSNNKVGSLVDANIFTLTMDINVFNANKLAKRLSDSVYNEIFVLSNHDRVEGYVLLKELWMADRKSALNAIVNVDVAPLSANLPLIKAMGHPCWEQFQTMPVVDSSGGFIGVLHHKDLRSEIEHQLKDKTLDSDKDMISTLVAFSELFWNAGAELLSDTSARKKTHKASLDE